MDDLGKYRDLLDQIKGDDKSDKMPMDHSNKRKRGLTNPSSDYEQMQHMSENGEPPFKKRKVEDMSSLHGNAGRQPAKSLYTVQNHTEASNMLSNDPEESEERKQKR